MVILINNIENLIQRILTLLKRRKIMCIVKIIGIAALTILFGFLLTAAYHALVEMLSEESNFTTGGWRDE